MDLEQWILMVRTTLENRQIKILKIFTLQNSWK